MLRGATGLRGLELVATARQYEALHAGAVEHDAGRARGGLHPQQDGSDLRFVPKVSTVCTFLK